MCSGDGGATARCPCALCGAAADVHCEADAAFLCAPCDAHVHAANFLASRHRRTRVLSSTIASTSTSSCVSGATTAAPHLQGRKTTPPARRRGEAVLESWAKRMGLEPGAARRCAAAAGRAIRFQVATAVPRVPLRVLMAAALWWEVSAAHGVRDPGEALRRLEACAHVPARLLVAPAEVPVTVDARVKKRTECSILLSPDTMASSPRHELCLFV